MAGNIARITSISFDGVPTELVDNCSEYVRRIVNEAGYGDNVRIGGVVASAMVQDTSVTSASVNDVVSDSDDDIIYVGYSPAPAAVVAAPAAIHEGRSSSSDSTSGSSSSSHEGSRGEDSCSENDESGRFR